MDWHDTKNSLFNVTECQLTSACFSWMDLYFFSTYSSAIDFDTHHQHITLTYIIGSIDVKKTFLSYSIPVKFLRFLTFF